jgi:hypothetical protein
VGHGQSRRARVVVACLGYSRAGAGALVFTTQVADLLFGIRRCLWSLGVLPETLVWDRQSGLHAHAGRPTAEFAAFCGTEGRLALLRALRSAGQGRRRPPAGLHGAQLRARPQFANWRRCRPRGPTATGGGYCACRGIPICASTPAPTRSIRGSSAAASRRASPRARSWPSPWRPASWGAAIRGRSRGIARSPRGIPPRRRRGSRRRRRGPPSLRAQRRVAARRRGRGDSEACTVIIDDFTHAPFHFAQRRLGGSPHGGDS